MDSPCCCWENGTWWMKQYCQKLWQYSQFWNHSKYSHGPSKGCTRRGRPKGIQHVSVSIGNQAANQLWEWEEETKAARTVETRVDLIAYQRIASLTAIRSFGVICQWYIRIMIASCRWEVVKHFVIYAELHVVMAGRWVHLVTGSLGCVQPKATAVKALLSLDQNARWGCLPGRLNDLILIFLVNGQGSARHGELNKED